MTEELKNLLARLREPGENPLSNEELTQLRDGLREHAEELRDAERTDEVVTTLTEIATAIGEIRAEQQTRADAAAERDRQAQEALDAIAQGDDDSGDDAGDAGDATAADTGADAAGSDDAAGDADAGATGADAADTTLPVAAAGTPARPKLGSVKAPVGRAPRKPEAPGLLRAKATLTAAGDLPGYSAGDEISSIDKLGASMAKKLRSMPTGTSVVASLTTEYPEERMLRQGATEANDEKMRAVIDDTQALTAAGGVCGPVAVDYNIPTFASTERPVRDALVRFGAERGGVTFTPPPKIADVSGATGIWTEAVDADPQSATKAILDVDCGSPETVLVDAVTTRLRFGNMQGRFQPEVVTANTQNALAAAARVADVNLLNKIHVASVEVTVAPAQGAGRALLVIIDQALAAIRYRMRLSDSARYRIIPPRWLKDMIRADFTKELPSGTDRLGMTDAEIDAYLTARGVNANWHLDGVAASTVTGRTYPDQTFADQAAGALAGFPAKVVFPIFPEGSFQFLDGGELNLGVVRDSTLNATNRYETFVETFENVAFRGVESLWVEATIAATGAASGTITPA